MTRKNLTERDLRFPLSLLNLRQFLLKLTDYDTTLDSIATGSSTNTSPDGASAVAASVNTSTSWVNAAARLQSWRNNSVEKLAVLYDGTLKFINAAANLDASALTGFIKLGAAGATISLFGATPVARAAAYIQTYNAASRTHANPTAATLTDNSGGASGGVTVAVVTDNASAANAIATLVAMVNKLTADQLNIKQVVNSLVDDSQAIGISQ